MRKLALLAAACALVIVVASPAALAQQDPCPDPDFPQYTPDGCQASNLPDVTPGATASASTSSSASASASATASASPSASASASASPEPLPDTGGPAGITPATLAGLALLLGGGLLGLRVIKRH